MAPHIKRWITGIIAVPLILAIIIYGSKFVFFMLIVLLVEGAVIEYNSMAFRKGFRTEKAGGVIIGFLIPLVVFSGNLHLILATITLSFIVVFLLFLFQIKDQPINIVPLAKVVFGFMYIPLMISHILLLRGTADGVLWVLFLIVLAFSSDIFAFYVGTYTGRKKLFSIVSAGKTVEGAIGSVVGGLLGGMMFKLLFFESLCVFHAFVLAFLGNVIGQLGDLCESAIKRACHVKDSGFILPGHGGILDRLDFLIFTIPFLYYYVLFVIK